MAHRVTVSKRGWGAFVFVAAALGATIWMVRAPTNAPNAPSTPTTASSSNATPLAPQADPARPDAAPPKVTADECAAGDRLFDDTTPQGLAHGCGHLDEPTKAIVREGHWSIVESTGNVFDGRYVDGLREGQWILWSPDGRAIRGLGYRRDKLDGWATEWNELGQKIVERHFKDGVLDGDVFIVHPDGTKVHEVWNDGHIVVPAPPAST